MIRTLVSITLILSLLNCGAQSIWTLKDPQGEPVRYSDDSAFVYHTPFEDLLALFAIDGAGNRNVLITDGKESHWLFATGKDPKSEFTPFTFVTGADVIFRIDSIWYISDHDLKEVNVFHDNRDTSNEYTYSWVFGFDYRLGIVAFERLSGNQVLLLYNPLSPGNVQRWTDSNGNDIRVFSDLSIGTTHITGIHLVSSIYDTTLQSWTEPGVYRIQAQPKLLLKAGIRQRYRIESFEWFGSYVVDYPDTGEVSVYKYNASQGVLEDVTDDLFDGDEILMAGRMKWPYGSDDVVNTTTDESLWKLRDSQGGIRYILRDGGNGFMPEWEIEDLRDAQSIDILISAVFFDTVYYYDYTDAGHGLVRWNFKSNNAIRDATGIPIDPEYELFGWEGRMYYAKYDPVEGKLFARYQDFTDGNFNAYMESSTGQRIENPISFYPVGSLMVVESKSDKENMFFVYDSAITTGIEDPQISLNQLVVFPNPSTGQYHIQSKLRDNQNEPITLQIYNASGEFLFEHDVIDGGLLDLRGQPDGVYMMYAFSNSALIGWRRLVLLR